VRTEDSEIVVVAPTENYETVRRAVSDAGIQYESAEVTMIPQTSVRIEGRDAEHMIRLMEALEDSDDVQNVYANFDIDEQLLEAIG
jgi:transcriptional/translational regulatory protein YebC/TACO1